MESKGRVQKRKDEKQKGATMATFTPVDILAVCRAVRSREVD